MGSKRNPGSIVLSSRSLFFARRGSFFAQTDVSQHLCLQFIRDASSEQCHPARVDVLSRLCRVEGKGDGGHREDGHDEDSGVCPLERARDVEDVHDDSEKKYFHKQESEELFAVMPGLVERVYKCFGFMG